MNNEDTQTNNDTIENNHQMMGGDSEEKSVGGTIGAIVVVLLIVIGGLYLFGKKQDAIQTAPSAEEILKSEDSAIKILETQGTSDEIKAIEKDTSATNFDGLDAELEVIENEIGSIGI